MHVLLWVLILACCARMGLAANCVDGYYNGLPCASTTRYTCDTEGACGCGVDSANTPYTWQTVQYTAAGSQGFFNPGDETVSWCGSGCGACYNITPTGDCPTGGNCVQVYKSIVVMVTNLCPYSSNVEWCPQPGTNNQHGFQYHFDLMDNNANVITPLGWDNPAVTFQQVPCDGNTNTPTCSEAATCVCSAQMNAQCTQGTKQSSSSSSTHSTSSTSTSTHSTSSASTTTHSTSSSSTHSTTTTTGSKTSSSGTTSASTATTFCTVGSESCQCTASGTCDAGLECVSSFCVNPGSAIKTNSASTNRNILQFGLLIVSFVFVVFM